MATRTRKPPAPKPDPDAVRNAIEATAEAIVADEPSQPNGVLVLAERNEDGNYKVDVQVLGDIRVTEAETLLGVARNVIRERLGIA